MVSFGIIDNAQPDRAPAPSPASPHRGDRADRESAPSDDRHAEVDVLRGAALFGVLMVNLLTLFRVPLLQHLEEFHTHPGRLNRTVDLLVGLLLETKAIAIFSLLFGASMAIQAERVRRRGKSYLALALRRLAVLVCIGLCHLVFIWNGDILSEYAVAGLLTLPALYLPRRFALVAAAVFLVVSALPLPLPQPDWPALRGHSEAAIRVYSTGSYAAIFRFRQLETARLIAPLLLLILPRTVGLMLLGQYAFRSGILRAPGAHHVLLRRVALVIPLALLLSLGEAAAAYAHLDLGRAAAPVALLTSVPLALGYAAALLLLLQRAPVRRALSGVAALGRLALSNYLTQSVVLGFVFYGYGGYGLGLMGRLGAAAAAPLGLALYGLQVAASARWLRRYRLGPVEWLWRSLTYGRPQPLRRTVPSAAAR